MTIILAHACSLVYSNVRGSTVLVLTVVRVCSSHIVLVLVLTHDQPLLQMCGTPPCEAVV